VQVTYSGADSATATLSVSSLATLRYQLQLIVSVRGVARSKYVGGRTWRARVWRRSDPPTPPLCKNTSDMYQFQERPLAKVGWTCPPQSTPWRRHWCLSVSLTNRHCSETAGRIKLVLAQMLSYSCPTLSCKESQVSLEIAALPSVTLSQTLYVENVATASRSCCQQSSSTVESVDSTCDGRRAVADG